jgi:hypothetical protein
MNDKKKYIVTDGKRVWYSNTVECDLASGILSLDEGRRFLINPDKFRCFEYGKEKNEEKR